MSIEQTIAKLPKEYREIARRYTTLLLDMADEEMLAWVTSISQGNWQKAYSDLIAKMPTDEILVEEQKGHEILKMLNKDNADRIGAQFAIIEQVLLTSLLMLRKEIET